MSSKKKLVLAAALLALAGGAFFFWQSRQGADGLPGEVLTGDAAAQRNKDIAERDERVWKDPGAWEGDKVTALLRQARQKNPAALQGSLTLAKSNPKDPAVRAGMVSALGNYSDPEAMNVVLAHVKDADAHVRQMAIRAIGRTAGEGREKALRDLVSKGGLSIDDSLAAYEGLLKVSTAEGDRAEALSKLVAAAQNSDGDSETQAILTAVSLAPRNEALLKLLRKKVTEGRNEHIVPVAIRHLAAIKDSWLSGEYARMHKSPDVKVRLAVIQTLSRACPSGRDQLLLSMMLDEDSLMVFRAGVQELAALPVEQYSALKDRLNGQIEREEFRQLLVEELPRLRSGWVSDPCDMAGVMPDSNRFNGYHGGKKKKS